MASTSASLSLSSLSSSLSQNWEHDVFPSFHGPDVRKSFLSHVLKEFRRKAINLFIDNEIKRGDFIGPALQHAIRGSKIAIVLLSKNYASSSWCLDELVEIMKKESGQMVITIFYEVDPTDVKKQTGDFGEVFKNTCQGKGEEKTEIWRKALEGVATIAGYHSSNWDDEAHMIEDIAAYISRKLNHLTPSHDFDHLIGMGNHMERMKSLLRLDLDEVRMIGIWGPPGIGKTTIARFLFDQVSSQFQYSALMEDVKGSYPKPCFDEYNAKLQLQNKMLSKMINHKDIKIPHLGVVHERLRDKKVFLVLDDVDCLAQIEALAKNVQWFGPRSRIIITTENLRILKAHGIDHIYKVNFPSPNKALQMFCMYAFDEKSPKDGFDELACEITYIVGKLPLALKVMGSYFRGLSKEQWSMEIQRLKANLNTDIESILKYSYDALCDEDKDLFLHIACFFNDEYKEKVEAYLAESFKNVRQGLHVLAENSLISIEGPYIRMHKLLAQLGKNIVRKQRQFLIDDEDFCEVHNDCRAITNNVIGIDSKHEFDTTKKTFDGISSLQFLRVRHDPPKTIHISALPPKLRLLDWECFPMKCLPFTSNLEFLVELRLPMSELIKLWDGIKLLRNLKWMELSYSRNLKKLPDLSMATNLKKLNLNGCSSLVELPSSIGNATNLEKLSLEGCSNLVKLPSSIGNLHRLQELYLKECSKLKALPININLKSLDILGLTDCSSLKSFPEISTNIRHLNVIGTSIKEVPCSIRTWSRLDWLCVSYIENLKEFPCIHNSIKEIYLRNIGIKELGPWVRGLSRLDQLILRGMQKLVSLPQLPDSLKLLYLEGCSSLVSLPKLPDSLESLYLNGCSSLVSLPKLPDSVEILFLNGCSNLVSVPKLPYSLTVLKAENCESLEKLESSFCNPDILLRFVNCFKLKQDARNCALLHGSTVLPGKEVPEWFTYRAYGSSVTVKLNQNPLPTSTKFMACILLDNKGANRVGLEENGYVSCCINSKEKNRNRLKKIVRKHLYIFDIEAEEVTSTELLFEYELDFYLTKENWEIKECGVLQLLEHHVDEEDKRFRGSKEAISENIDSESSDEEDEDSERFRGGDEAINERKSSALTWRSSIRRQICYALFCLLLAFLLHSLFLSSTREA